MECTPGFVNAACTGLGLLGAKKEAIPGERKNMKGEETKQFWSSGSSAGTMPGSSFIPLIYFVPKASRCSSHRHKPEVQRGYDLSSQRSFHFMSWANLIYFQKPHMAFIPACCTPPPAHRLAFPGPGGALSGLSITAGHLESDHRSSCILHLRHKCHWRYYSGGLMGYLSTPCFSKQLGGFSAWMKAPETSVLA